MNTQTIKVEDAKWVRNARKKVQRKNAKFRKANNRRKIMMICEDVISNLCLGTVTPVNGTYMNIFPKSMKRKLKLKPDMEVQSLLADPLGPDAPRCEVCAIGVAMYSTIRLADKLRFDSVESKDAVENSQVEAGESIYRRGGVKIVQLDHLADDAPWMDIFGLEMLRDMEAVFEHHHCNPLSDLIDPHLVMFAVYENILMNKGELKIPEHENFRGCERADTAMSTERMLGYKKEVEARFTALKKKALKKF